MENMFWDSEGVICVDFLPCGVTSSPQYYSNLHHNNMCQAIWKKRCGKLSEETILLHGNTCQHMASFMKVTLVTMGWEIMYHPAYSPDLGPSDIHLSGPMKVYLRGQLFQTED
jgi:histone-lysine N-methyltransferase SETMAR